MIEEKAHAKINLALDVVRKRKDGFHELKMIMIPVELHDVLRFETHESVFLESNIEIENNAILKATNLMQKTFGIKQGAKITLIKNIPIGAGLGGGSADIAATIRGLNRLWQLNLEMDALEEIAISLGSDTLFCLYERPAFVYGRGEKMLFIERPPIKDIYVFPHQQSVSTKAVFKAHKVTHQAKRFDRLFRLYLNEKYTMFFKSTYNDLAKTTFRVYPEIKKHYKSIRKIDSGAFMSGSGSSMYLLSFSKNIDEMAKKIEKCEILNFKTKPKS
ncbi:MAG: 4-(cytidine 5'-diphospho)-2-C-methyl-D-erythritol kinase [Acholeplasmataceae bacterium]|nr:4-(cytidine 5'-diphospho)-2-C-methyl-D-erythritol kinase [Acholeplasmataceae bacterium]